MKRIYALTTLLLISILSCGCESTGSKLIISPPDSKPDSGTTDPGTTDPTDPGDTTPDVDAPDRLVIIGYATYWDSTMPDPSLLTHINYAFAHIKDDFESLDIKNPTRLSKIAALKDTHPSLKVVLSIGGWGAGNFSEMAADETHRKKFAQNCLTAVKSYNLDGIDIDWEYPTSGKGAGISDSPDDTKNFTLMIKELRATLGQGMLLTMATSASARYISFKDVMPYMDYANIMTYDMGKPPYHNAGLYASSMTSRSCDESVKLHYQAGVPYNKIVMGIPFFGHDGHEEVDYNEIDFSGKTVRWDDDAMVPYLVNASGQMVLTYDDERSVGLKADYILQKKLGGAMYWNIEADDKNWTLSKAIASRLLSNGETGDDSPSYQVTHPYMQKFIEEVEYPEKDYSITKITEYPGGGPGEADIPPSVVLEFPAISAAGTLKVWESGWSREYSLAAGASQCELVNLVPNVNYSYTITSGNDVIVGSFRTTGSVHQVYFPKSVRNCRDLGGWKGLGGKSVVYRKLYRGGKVSSGYCNDEGKQEFRAAGIKAELDLREKASVPSSSPIGSDIAFCAPGFEDSENYRTMLRDRAAGIKESFDFIVDCLRKDKPVYFHCAAGRDRTGTLAMVLLGVLGVSESDISKDYELTYFSPADWSMYQGSYQHVRTSGGFTRACQYLWDFGATGDNLATCVEKYLISIGVNSKDIADFRSMMLK